MPDFYHAFVHIAFELLGVVLGVIYYQRLKKQNPISSNNLHGSIVIFALVWSAFFGSKLVGFLEHPELWKKSLENPILFFSAKSILGGLFFGMLGIELAKSFLKINKSTGDLFCYPVILAIMVGRVGCFLAGLHDHTYGTETSFWTGYDFGDGIRRHPTQLYEIVFLGLLWLLLIWFQRNYEFKNGLSFKIFMIFYAIWRFTAEYIKPVEQIEVISLTAIQVTSILILFYYLLHFSGLGKARAS